MNNIAIIILILSITLHSAVFEHSTDVKKNYKFDSDKQAENEKLASELPKFINNTASQIEIDMYIKLRDEDNQTKTFDKDIYVDAGILKQRNIVIVEPNIKEDFYNWLTSFFSYESGACNWLTSLFGCGAEIEDENIDSNSSDEQLSEEAAEVTEDTNSTEVTVEKGEGE
jgi:hypothetical protein